MLQVLYTETLNRAILALIIAGAFVAGTILTGALAYAVQGDDKGKPFQELFDALDARLVLIENSLSSLPEVCDDIDNNINGEIDETFPDKGDACSVGLGICEVSAEKVCSLDGVTTVCGATPGTPLTEVCSDGLDNDCDGTIDESVHRRGWCQSALNLELLCFSENGLMRDANLHTIGCSTVSGGLPSPECPIVEFACIDP